MMLRALVLTLDHDARGEVGNAYRRVGSIDVLTAGACSSVGVDSQVFLSNFDFDVFVYFRINEQGSKGGMPPCSLIEGGNSHQAVDASLGGQQTVSIFTFHPERYSFKSRFLSGLVIDDFRFEATLLCPFQVHPQQHFRPILRLGSAGTRMYRANRIELVVATA